MGLSDKERCLNLPGRGGGELSLQPGRTVEVALTYCDVSCISLKPSNLTPGVP